MEFLFIRIRTEKKAKKEKVATQEQQTKINQANRTLESDALTIYTVIDENNEIVGTRPKDR